MTYQSELVTFATANGIRNKQIVRQIKYKEDQQLTLQEVSTEGYPIGRPKFVTQAELSAALADPSIKWDWTVLVPHWIETHLVDSKILLTVVRRSEDLKSFAIVATFDSFGDAEIATKMLDIYALNGEYRLGLAWQQMLKERAIVPNPEEPFIGLVSVSGLPTELPLSAEEFYDLVRIECADRAAHRNQLKSGTFQLNVPHEPIWLGALRRVLSGFKFGLKV